MIVIKIIFECKVCEKEFQLTWGDYNTRLRHNYIPKFCSQKCAWKGRTGVSTRLTRNHCKGKNHPMYGKTFKRFPKRSNCKYKGITMRSSWEVLMAKWLDSKNVIWEYEPEEYRIKYDEFSYLPDFYVKEWNLIIEVKGYITKQWNEKFERILEDFPIGYPEYVIATDKMINHIKEKGII